MKMIISSFKSVLSVAALAAGILFAGSAVAATVPVYGSVSDITENTVILTGDASVTSSKSLKNVTLNIHFNNVTGRSAMSNVALKAVSDQSVVKPLAGSTTVSFPVTIFPADSDPTDPQAFTATATADLTLDATTGTVKTGMTKFTIVLQETP